MVILEAGEFPMGSPATESDRQDLENLHRRKIGRPFAIAAHEVTNLQFAAFQRERSEIAQVNTDLFVKTDDSPQTAMTWFEAAAYCKWLSQKEGLTEDQWCYEPNAQKQYAAGMKPKPRVGELLGYRLPSEAEWEYACRAGSVTSRYYGSSERLLPKYAWHLSNGKNRTWPVGSLKPNDAGLFDMLGNAFEWTHEPYKDYPNLPQLASGAVADSLAESRVTDKEPRILRGASFNHQSSYVRSAARNVTVPTSRAGYFGFRVARTYVPALP
jgi:formylglycine-generating enzyme required for sulfatase activity